MPHKTAAVLYTIQPCYFMQSHIHKVHVCLAVICHLPSWQNDWDLLHTTVAINTGVERDTKIRVSTKVWLWRRKFPCCSGRDMNLWPFIHKSRTLTTDLSQLPREHVNSFPYFPHYAWAVQTANSNCVGSRMYECVTVICHLHFWQNNRVF